MAESNVEVEFLVKAQNWDEVVKIFKAELGIDKGKKDTSVRNINGFFLVLAKLRESQLSKDFFSKVEKSELIAIVNNPADEKIRNEMLAEICKVENHLRRLLLHVSDIVDSYLDYFSESKQAKQYSDKKAVILGNNLNPITSQLTIENILSIMGQDLSSWENGRRLTVNDLLEILNDCDDINTLKKKLNNKIKKDILWNHISKNVCKNNIKWEDIKDEIGNIKELRNKAAHFRALVDADLIGAKKLSKSIISKTQEKKTVTTKDISKLQDSVYPGYYESMRLAAKQFDEYMARNREAINEISKVTGTLSRPAVEAVESLRRAQTRSLEGDRPKALLEYGTQTNVDRKKSEKDEN